MDRIVYLIVLTVITIIVLDLSDVTAQTADSRQFQSSGGQTQPEVQSRAVAGNDNTDPRTFAPQRNSLFDNIFKIPIDTLNAVNELLQGFTRGFGGSGYRKPSTSSSSS